MLTPVRPCLTRSRTLASRRMRHGRPVALALRAGATFIYGPHEEQRNKGRGGRTQVEAKGERLGCV
jgi:hypothetical protein